MLKYTIKRLLQLIPLLILLSLLVFTLIRMVPGDPVLMMLGIDTPKDNLEVERERLGLNDPLPVQYLRFVSNAVQGDLGVSIVSKRPVAQEIASRYPATFTLALGGTVVATLIGIVFGIIAAVKHNKFTDNFIFGHINDSCIDSILFFGNDICSYLFIAIRLV